MAKKTDLSKARRLKREPFYPELPPTTERPRAPMAEPRKGGRYDEHETELEPPTAPETGNVVEDEDA